VEITKSGSYIYYGTANDFHEWEFRTRLRVKASGQDDERYAAVMSQVIDGPRGDAFIIAKELGLDRIWDVGDDFSPSGVDTLIEAIKASVFPLTTHEAKELFRQYCKPVGSLSRQNGESMQQYISRRRRCWKLLKELDPEIVLSEGHRADMLLDLAGLDKNERTMIQASIANARDFEKIADALVVQHPRIHLKATSSYGGDRMHGKSRGKGKRKGKSKFRPWRNPSGFANLATEEWDEDATAYLADDQPEAPSDPAHWHEDYDYDAYYADDWKEPNAYAPDDWNEEDSKEAYVADEWEVDDPREAAELDCVACLFDALGKDCMSDPDRCACFVQDGTTAFLAYSKGKGKGKGKFNGKKGGRRYPVRPSNLSIEDRRKKLKELKSRTECKDCGRKGHWSGDKECTMSKQKTGMMAVKDRASQPGFDLDSDDENPTAFIACCGDSFHCEDEESDDVVFTACMAVRVPRPVTVKKASVASSGSMEWQFEDGNEPPRGSDRKFTAGTLKNKTFINVTLEHPEQYFSTYKSKTLTAEAKDYIKWVQDNFDVDAEGKQVKIKDCGPILRVSGGTAMCSHSKTHNKGSSARYIQTTCCGCGEVWKEERNPPTKSPEECTHCRTDHRGSNKQVRKTWCIDCGTYIDSVAQSLAKSLKDENPWITIEEQALLNRVAEHDTINKEQIIRAANLMLAEAQKLEDGDYKLLDMGNMFIDCADRSLSDSQGAVREPGTTIVDDGCSRNSLPGKQRTAMAAVREKNVPAEASPSLGTVMHEDKGTTSLKVIDPFTHPGVWAIVDDGCNSCTHSEKWRLNAMAKWKKLGFAPYLRDSKSTNFSGVGERKTNGKWKLPCGLLLEESQLNLPGGLDSHEIADGTHCLLLSQSVQAKLGFLKSTRHGTITMEDYDHQHLEVARQVKTGLFMIRIDHLTPELYEHQPTPLKNLLVIPTHQVQSSSDEDISQSATEHSALVARNHGDPPKPLEHSNPWKTAKMKRVLEAKTVIVSCGLLNFEDSNLANGSCKDFINGLPSDPKICNDHFTAYPLAEEVFLRSFKKNFPELCKGRHIIVIDCTGFYNPDDDKTLRGHTGRHYKTLESLANDEKFAKINKPLQGLRLDKPNLVINSCKVGRHRSVGNEELEIDTINHNMYDNVPGKVRTVDLQAERHWKHLCKPDCPDCHVLSSKHKAPIQTAINILKRIVPKKERPSIPPPPDQTVRRSADVPPVVDVKDDSKHAKKGNDDLPSILTDLVALYTEESTVTVLQKLLEVFKPNARFFDMLQMCGGPVGILKEVMTNNQLDLDVFIQMYHKTGVKIAKENPSSSSGGHKPRSRSRSRDETWRKVSLKPTEKVFPRREQSSGSTRAEEKAMEESDHSSDHPCRKGRKPDRPRRDLPEDCSWGGPNGGDDNDSKFLADARTGSAKRDLTDEEDWSPDEEDWPGADRDDAERPQIAGSERKRRMTRDRSLSRRGETRRPRNENERGRSRSRQGPRIVLKRKNKGASKGKDKDKGKDKGSRGKGSKGRGKNNPVDDASQLSERAKQFHQELIDAVPEGTDGLWKDEFLNHYSITGENRAKFLADCFGHLDDLGKAKNKRIYIGPGRDGSSDDKIAIDCKFSPQNTKVTYNKTWKQLQYVKTSYALFEGEGRNCWMIIEDQADIDTVVNLHTLECGKRPTKLVVMCHPMCNIPAGLCDDNEEPLAAYMAVDPDYDFEEGEELDCFYCGEDLDGDPCKTCGQGLCANCIAVAGCACNLAADKEVVVESFVPKPGQGKATTFSQSQRKKVRKGAETVEKQDNAMWSTLTGKPHRLTPLKKCLLAVTAFSNLFVSAIGHTTTFVDPTTADSSLIDSLNRTIEKQDPSLIYVHVPFEDDATVSKDYCRLKEFVDDQMKAGKTCVIADSRHTDRWSGCEPALCRGDLAFHCNDSGITKELVEWARIRDNGNPRCTDDLAEPQFADVLSGLAESHHLDKCVDAAFVGTEEATAENKEAIAENNETIREAIDAVYGPEDELKADEVEARDEEADLLEKIPLPGNPVSERERKKIWLSLPRRARIVIRRLHRNFRHLPKQALVQMLRAAKVPKQFIDAAKAHRCDVCVQNKPPTQTHKVGRPKPYVFNHEVGVDALEVKDCAGTFFDILNCLDYGTSFQQAGIVREGENNGTPSSSNCLDWFVKGWVRPFGWPKVVAGDRGTHNRGVFNQTLSKKGVRFNPAALESPEHIGRVERSNQTLKRMLIKVIKETNATGRQQVDMCLTECITAMNELQRHGGFAPVQWVLAKFPRQPATMGDEEECHDIGAIQAHLDGPTQFALQAKYRLAARETFIKWDCGERVQKAYLRNAAPVPGPYKVGDVVSYCRRARKDEVGIQWSVGSKIVGFEVDSKEPDKDPHAAWVICDGIPVCVATDKIRPCTAAELLAYTYMHGEGMPAVSQTQTQQSFIDERDLPHKKAKRDDSLKNSPGAALSSAAAETNISSSAAAEMLPDVPMFPHSEGPTVKELRAHSAVPRMTTTLTSPPPLPSKRDASPSLASSLKRNKVTGKGVQMLEKIAYLFDEDCNADMSSEKVGFLQVRLAAPKQKKITQKTPKPKDGDKNLAFASCSPEIQTGLRKSRVVEWKKWKQFNAGVILSRDELNQLRDEGVQVYPMQWIETDRNAHKRRADKFVPPDLKSRLVGCGNFEDTEGLRTDSPTGDVDSHNLVFSWCASNKVKIRSADISNAYLQGKQNDRVILYRIPKGGIPEEGIAEGDVLAARVPIYGTKDAGRGFWLRLKEVVMENGYALNQILPTMFVLRHMGRIVGTMSSNVDDLLYGSLPEYEQVMNNILDEFSVKEKNATRFRFCGKEVVQHDDMSITVTAKDNTEKIRPIDIGEKRRGTDKCNSSETTCLRSVVASMAWVARQVRPGLSYRVSKLQSVAAKGTIKDMRDCNKVLEFAQNSSTEGIHFASSGITWDEAVVCSISDASFCNETIVIDGEKEDGRSQQGYLICLAPAGIVNMMEAIIHPISWSSTHIHRVCRSTLMAETFALNKAIEAGTRIRAAIVDMMGKLDIRNWEETAAQAMGHCWMTDCESLYEHLMSQRFNSIENKRLAVDLKALRQHIWERSGERTLEVDHSCGDYPRWIDTSVMLADPLTKAMKPDRLEETMRTGRFDLRPTAESLMIKERNRACRKAASKKGKENEAPIMNREDLNSFG
jgi:hypothetical protein